MPHRDNGLHDAGVLRIAFQVGNEIAVDLEFVEPKAAQITQRRITRPEVIHRNTNTKRLESIELLQRFVAIFNQKRLGNFQFKPLTGQATLGKGVLHDVDQVVPLELSRRQIHGDAHWCRPLARVTARLAQYELADRHDETTGLGHRDEHGGLDFTEFLVSPAQQCFKANRFTRIAADQRLIGELQCACLDGPTQTEFDPVAALQSFVHSRFKKAAAPLAACFRPIHCGIGIAQHLVD